MTMPDFRVGPWLVRPTANVVVKAGRVHRIAPKAMDLLVCLSRRNGEVVSKSEIFRDVWTGTFVSDDALVRCIGELRRALRDNAQHPAIIETVTKRGYRIVAPVSWETSGCAPAEGPSPRRQPSGKPSRIRSIAVLPLLNLSGDAEQDYFADGITEVLTSGLSKLANLQVISRTSAMTYKGSRKGLRAIARELQVDALLEGSVTRFGPQVRVVAQLIDSATDTHLWTQAYERDFVDVLRLQSEIVQAIVKEIRIATTPEEIGRVSYVRRVKPGAYEAYLKGMFHLNKFTPEGFELGIASLQQAVEQDPGDPFAYAALALGYGIMGHDRLPDALARARAAALRSLDFGGDLAEAHLALGMVALYSDWDLPGAGRQLERALQLNPNFAEARRDYSWYLRACGRPKAGLEEMRHAEALEPLVPLFSADLAWQYFEEGRFDAALVEARKSIELDPKFAEGLAVEGWALTALDRRDEALAAHVRAASADAAWKWPLGRTYALMGRKDDARKIAAELGEAPGPMDQWGLAVIYAALGEANEALRWLDAAYTSRFSWMPWIADFSRLEPDLFTSLRHDRRLDALIKRIGVPATPSVSVPHNLIPR